MRVAWSRGCRGAHSMKHTTLWMLRMLCAMPALAACVPPSTDEELTSETDQAITTNDILARAREWVAAQVPYCGGLRGGPDLICGGTCERPAAPGERFRSDCSGVGSWAGQILDDPTTATYVTDRAGADGWTTISIDSLRPGDALVTDGHMKLFSHFVGTNGVDILEEFSCGHVAHEEVETFTRSGNTLRLGGDSRIYHAIRRNGVTTPPPPVVEIAFQSNTHNLWTMGTALDRDWKLGMMPGTSPSI